MPYVGGSLVSLFGKEPKAATRLAARRMAERGGDRMVEITVINTPIGGRDIDGTGGGNLRSSWYQLPTKRIRHVLGPAYQSGVASNVEYAPYVEHGTGLWGPRGSKYPIRPKNPGGMLRWRSPTGGYVYARVVMHPGSPGQHMVAIAGEVTEAEVDSGGLFDSILNEWARTVEASAD